MSFRNSLESSSAAIHFRHREARTRCNLFLTPESDLSAPRTVTKNTNIAVFDRAKASNGLTESQEQTNLVND